MKRKTPRQTAGIKVEFQIGGELWREVPTFESAGPEDRVFVVSTNLNGSTSVFFGDGTNGARLPTAASNVTAIYRTSRHFSAVLMQQGRVIIDKGWNDPGQIAGRYYGVYPGVVAGNVEPLGAPFPMRSPRSNDRGPI